MHKRVTARKGPRRPPVIAAGGVVRKAECRDCVFVELIVNQAFSDNVNIMNLRGCMFREADNGCHCPANKVVILR